MRLSEFVVVLVQLIVTDFVVQTLQSKQTLIKSALHSDVSHRLVSPRIWISYGTRISVETPEIHLGRQAIGWPLKNTSN